MEESPRRTVSAPRGRRGPAGLCALALAVALACGCSGRYARPRTLAAAGGLAVGGGGATWAAGQDIRAGGGSGGEALINSGFVAVAVGLVAIVVAGGWMATSVACNADPDCDEEEQCREIPAPPGGIPYKQCMAR